MWTSRVGGDPFAPGTIRTIPFRTGGEANPIMKMSERVNATTNERIQRIDIERKNCRNVKNVMG